MVKSDGSYDNRLVSGEEGPVHAAVWSPSTLEFAVCYGKVPATVRRSFTQALRLVLIIIMFFPKLPCFVY